MHIVVITGVAGGMGRALAERCVSDGATVVGVDRDALGLEGPRSRLGDAFVPVVCDVALPKVGAVVLGSLPDGALRGLVNLAGISRGASIREQTDADWHAAMAVNVDAPMRLCRALVPRLLEAGGGSIVNVASPVAVLGARKVAYAASKAALLGLNVALARELGPFGIRVNAVFPGATITGMTEDWSEERRASIAAESFLRRLCTPREVAGAVAFLLGPDSSFVTGTILDVTGGAAVGAHG